MSKRKYYVYDHSQQDWCNRWSYDNFYEFIDFMNNGYDLAKHSVHDTLEGHKECCKNNDIYDGDDDDYKI